MHEHADSARVGRDRVVVVGAGPAGLAAARAAAAAGARVLLVDAEPAVGGQYARVRLVRAGGPAHSPPEPADPRIEHLANTSVWAVEKRPAGARLHLRTGAADAPDRAGRVVDAVALILATGAHDRTIPFPGWDLPGVVTAGGAQALAKAQGLAIGRRVLVAGTGPFLLPVATSLLAAGAQVLGVLEANPIRTNLQPWVRDPAGLWTSRRKASELAGYLRTLAAHRVRYRPGHAVVAAHADAASGTSRLAAVTVAALSPDWTIRPGSRRRVAADAVCVGYGFSPRLECAIAAGCELEQGFVRVDRMQATSVPGVYAAGEITGIGGVDLARAEGAVAGAAAAAWARTGRAGAPGRSAGTAVATARRFASTLAAAYPVRAGWQSWLTADTVVCRCEEVTLAGLRAAQARLAGAGGPRTVKLASRVAMGPCQGRFCARAVADLIPELDAGFADRRRLGQPIRLGELASAPLEPGSPAGSSPLEDA